MSDKDKKTVVKNVLEALPEDRIEQILEKEWAVAELPSEEKLAEEKHKSPMARNNPNSRANLIQYKRRDLETKKKNLEPLKIKTKVEFDISEDEVVRIKSKIMNDYPDFIPVDDVFSEQEKRLYYKALDTYLQDFADEDLSALDIDDIQTLALNKVMIIKLMSVAHSKPRDIVEISSSIQKYKQDSIKIKESLAVRRKDRVDPRLKDQVTILDLASLHDEETRKEKLDTYDKSKEGREVYRRKMGNVLESIKEVKTDDDN
jgi:hypothetical protein